MKILFKNANILNLDSSSGFVYGNVGVEGDKIVYVGEILPKENYDRVIDVKGNILMPGFVNAHCHSAMTLLRGIKDDVNLQDWLFNYIQPAEAKLLPDDIFYGQMLAILEYAKAGITTIEENYFTNNQIVKAIETAKIRARVGFGMPTPLADKKKFKKDLKIIGNRNLIKPVVYIHSAYAIKEDNICECLSFAKKHNLDVSVHLSETLKEVGDCTVFHKQTPPEYLESLGFFDRNALCYHCVHMDKDDLQILANYGASVATCPSSNIKLASGIAPVYAMINKGINITIGTDGAASNNSLDMFKEMFLVATLSKVNIYNAAAVTAKQVLAMATKNGAMALGFNTGEIKVDKLADIILIDINQPHFYPHDNLLSALVYSAKSSDVYLTMVGGNVLYENNKFNVGMPASEIYTKCNEIRRRITNGN